jgi:hypothetical protein
MDPRSVSWRLNCLAAGAMYWALIRFDKNIDIRIVKLNMSDRAIYEGIKVKDKCKKTKGQSIMSVK